MNWTTWVLFMCLLLISPATIQCCKNDQTSSRPRECLTTSKVHFVVPDIFNGVINADNHYNQKVVGCIIFLQKNATEQQCFPQQWPQIVMKDGVDLLLISKWHTRKPLYLHVLHGRLCNDTVSNLSDSKCVNDTVTEPCKVTCFHTKTICEQSSYSETTCNNLDPQIKDKYIINITATNKTCDNCDNPVKKPEEEFNLHDLTKFNISLDLAEGEEVSPAQAADVMNKMSDLATSINGSSAALTLGEGAMGILVRKTEPDDLDEVSFAYVSPNASLNIIENRDSLSTFSRSVTVPKEAFEKTVNLSVVPFAAVFRFINLSKDDMNSTVLGNEVLAVEMGTTIINLTETISINFNNVKYKGIPSCQSWNGEGSRPNWTGGGCLTIQNGDNITCQCSHLTFFAILLTPLNKTISSSDLKNLTIITQVGCGLSMFFLGIVLFMHFLLRKTKASKATTIFIHLVSAMFFLNFTFLVNNSVAKLKSSVGCKIMAALMHYFMLATFTWFALQAFHLFLLLHMRGKIVIHHYILKVSITGWFLPSVVGIVLLIIGKYGQQVIYTNDTEETVAMCWITDSDIHYIVNIGYYTLVFLFTFTAFIIILSWLFFLKRTNPDDAQVSKSGRNILTILGLCCMLGISWGLVLFAYNILWLSACYIFTVLNSFQGFFLFIYYYNTSHSGEINSSESGHKNFKTSNSTTTLDTSLDSFKNPYINSSGKK